MADEALPGGGTAAISAKEWKFVQKVVQDIHDGRNVDVHDMADAQNIATKGGYMKTAAAIGVAITKKAVPPPPAPPASAAPPPAATVQMAPPDVVAKVHPPKAAHHHPAPKKATAAIPMVSIRAPEVETPSPPSQGVLPHLIMAGFFAAFVAVGITYERRKLAT